MLAELRRVLGTAPVPKLGYVVTGSRGDQGSAYGYGYGYGGYGYREPKPSERPQPGKPLEAPAGVVTRIGGEAERAEGA
jgi:hypothetical protein